MAGGRPPDTPVAVVQDGTMRIQRSARATLATVADVVRGAEIAPPAVIVVGAVAGLAVDPVDRIADPPERGRRSAGLRGVTSAGPADQPGRPDHLVGQPPVRAGLPVRAVLGVLGAAVGHRDLDRVRGSPDREDALAARRRWSSCPRGRPAKPLPTTAESGLK